MSACIVMHVFIYSMYVCVTFMYIYIPTYV
jgi:hypothetical protein